MGETVNHIHIEPLVGRRKHAQLVCNDEQPLNAQAEPDAGRRLAAHLLREIVVSSPTQDRVLGSVEGIADELERGARVVVEAAHETRSKLVSDVELVEAALYLLEVLTRLVAQMLGELWRALDDVLPILSLGVENPQWVRFDPIVKLRTHRLVMLKQVMTQHLDILGSTRSISHRVQEQRCATQHAKVSEQPMSEGDDLDIDIRVVHTQSLDSQLPVLPVPPLLRSFVPKEWRQIPDLPGPVLLVLNVRTDDGSGPLWPQG